MTFERFKELRLEKGLSIEELSKELDIRTEIIESIENGFNAPIHVLRAYAQFFSVTSDYLLNLTDDRHATHV